MKRCMPLFFCLCLLAGCASTSSSVGARNGAGTQSVSVPAFDPAFVSPDPAPSLAPSPDAVPEADPGVTPAPAAPSPLHAVVLPAPVGDVVEIREKLFIAQTNDIYLNAEDYLGKTLRYEGFFDEYIDEFTGNVYRLVLRNGPGCCGYDQSAGFEVIWDQERDYPALNDWVAVTGVLETYDEDGAAYLRVRLTDLEVLDVRGAEYVEN
ncbi:MAG: hypothetical protein LBC26_00760 [Oscillospiraceae bacterium]|jgi:hypothetical protein|nr:hypothetical protein [Oscillospiraceae bacterium]